MFPNLYAQNFSIYGGQFVNVERDDHKGRASHGSCGDWKTKGERILLSNVAGSAFHNSRERFNAPKCHPDTRTAVLTKIFGWAKDRDSIRPLMWLRGPAGAGKSAIAQSIAEMAHKKGILAASFFFSGTAHGRNSSKKLVATLAYQISQQHSKAAEYIYRAIADDPLLFKKSLNIQFDVLIAQPLVALREELTAASLGEQATISSPTWLVILDGLDECRACDAQENIILAISEILQKYPSPFLPLAFFIASRPEYTIRQAFKTHVRHELCYSLVLDDTFAPDRDIELFLRCRFAHIRHTHPLRRYLPLDWPLEEDLLSMVAASSGQFIYAATAMKYLESHRHSPTKRLKVVLGLIDGHGENPFTPLDNLYSCILQEVKYLRAVLQMLLAILSCSDVTGSSSTFAQTGRFLDHLLFLDPGDHHFVLIDMHSLLEIDEDNKPIRMFHRSFVDFLTDDTRSSRFTDKIRMAHSSLAMCCLEHLAKLTPSSELKPMRCVELYAGMSMIPHLEASSGVLVTGLLQVFQKRTLEHWMDITWGIRSGNGTRVLESQLPQLLGWASKASGKLHSAIINVWNSWAENRFKRYRHIKGVMENLRNAAKAGKSLQDCMIRMRCHHIDGDGLELALVDDSEFGIANLSPDSPFYQLLYSHLLVSENTKKSVGNRNARKGVSGFNAIQVRVKCWIKPRSKKNKATDNTTDDNENH